MDNFIVEFKQAFSSEFCHHLIEKFKVSESIKPGAIGSGVDKSKKNSLDLHISTLPDWTKECQQVQSVLMQGLVQYARRYPFILTGPISPSIQDAETGEVRPITYEQISLLNDQQVATLLAEIYEPAPINMQFYPAKEGGFPHWHSEHYPHPTDTTQGSLRRVLLWLIYLNDVEQGGETEFFFQQAFVKPETGNLVISPCGFTHTHRGNTPISGDKYVLASWIMYKEANQLYKTV